MKLTQLIILLGFIWNAYCVVPIELDAQLAQSQGVIIGIVEQVDESAKATDSLSYVVEVKLLEWIGFTPDNNQSIMLNIPVIDDGTSSVLPKILVGEKIAGVLSIQNGKYYLLNSAQSKFSIKKIGSDQYFVNDAFPYHPKIGQVPGKKFKQIITSHFKEPFKVNKIELSESKSHNLKRDIASRVETTKQNEQSNFSPFWLLALLAGLSILATQLRLKQIKK
jgi:hypothetical protein